jgi:hypothetical protein
VGELWTGEARLGDACTGEQPPPEDIQ